MEPVRSQSLSLLYDDTQPDDHRMISSKEDSRPAQIMWFYQYENSHMKVDVFIFQVKVSQKPFCNEDAPHCMELSSSLIQ